MKENSRSDGAGIGWTLAGSALLFSFAACCLLTSPAEWSCLFTTTAKCRPAAMMTSSEAFWAVTGAISLVFGALAGLCSIVGAKRWLPARIAARLACSVARLLSNVFLVFPWLGLLLLTGWLFNIDRIRRSVSTHRVILRLARGVYGGGRRVWISGIFILFFAWISAGLWGLWPNTADNIGSALLETAYRMIVLIGGSDNLLQGTRTCALCDSQGILSVPLQIARWSGALLPLWVALPPLFVWLLRSSERNTPRSLLSGHYVVLGYGQVGTPLVKDLLDNQALGATAVVIVDNAAASAMLDAARRHGAIVLEQDAQDERVFVDVAAHRAAGILVATGSSSRNIDIAGRLARHIRLERDHARPLSITGEPPRIVPHIADRKLMEWATSDQGDEWLKGGPDSDSDSDAVHRPAIWPFSADQIALRQLLADRPIAAYAAMRPVQRPHIVILGFDPVAEWLIPQVLQATLMQGLGGPRITVIVDANEKDGGASTIMAKLVCSFPFLDASVHSETHSLRQHLQIDFDVEEYDFDTLETGLFDKAAPASPAIAALGKRLTGERPGTSHDPSLDDIDLAAAGDPVTSIFVCFGSDDRNLDVALRLQHLIRRYRRWRAPTFVRLYQDSGLEDVLSRSDRQLKLAKVIDDFGQDERVCTAAEIFDPPRDHAAREVQRIYDLGESISTLAQLLAEKSASNMTSDEWKRVAQRWQEQCQHKQQRPHANPGLLEQMQNGEAPTTDQIADWLVALNTRPEDKKRRTRSSCEREIDALLQALDPPSVTGKTQSPSSDDAFAALPFKYIVSNRDQVDHLPVKLRGLGYRDYRPQGQQAKMQGSSLLGPWPVPRSEGPALNFRIARESRMPDAIQFPERLKTAARLEHNRYMVERLMTGWQYGPIRDDDQRHHPSLRPYHALATDPLEQLKDERSVLDLRDILAARCPIRTWHPECIIGILGPTLRTSSQETALKATIQKIVLDTVLALEAEALAREFAPIRLPSRTSGNGHASNLEQARDALAVCMLSSLRPGTAITVARSAYDWAHPISQGNCNARDIRRPFRLIIPRATPFSEHENDVRLEYDSQESDETRKIIYRKHREELTKLDSLPPQVGREDWWEIDLLPEGLAAIALNPYAQIKAPPTQDTARSKSDDRKTTADSLKQYNEDRRELLERVRTELLKRETAYITERADWLILVETAEPENQVSADPAVQQVRNWRRTPSTIPKAISSLPRRLRPQRARIPKEKPGPRWDSGIAGHFVLPRDACPDGCTQVTIDLGHRLVEITLAQ